MNVCVCILALFIRQIERMRVLYCHLWPVCVYHIFPHYTIKDTIFDEEMNTKLVGLISPTTWSDTFLIIRQN